MSQIGCQPSTEIRSKLTNHRVSAVSSRSEGSLDLVLSISRVAWKDSVHTIKIDFGKSNEIYQIARQGKVLKRASPVTSKSVVVAATGAAPSTVSFPVPASSTPTARSAHKDLSFSYKDTPLLPPSFPGVDSVTLNAPLV